MPKSVKLTVGVFAFAFLAAIIVMGMGWALASPSAQTPVIGAPITAPLINATSPKVEIYTASDVKGCADQTSGGVCDDILGANLDVTLQAVNLDIVNARQAIQIATNDASDADAKATAAQTTANAAQTTANANVTTIGTVPAPLTTVGAWLSNFQSAVQSNANAAANADQAADAAQTTADTKRTEPQVQTAIDASLATFQEPGGSIINGSIAEIKFTPAVVVKLNTTAPRLPSGACSIPVRGEYPKRGHRCP